MATNPEKDYILVMCPHCGKKLDIPYIYDGTYQIHDAAGEWHYHNGVKQSELGCGETFYVAIIDGRLHIHGTEESLEKFLNKIKGS